MASNYLAKGLKRSALTVALGLCFAGGVQAQSTSGAIFGSVPAGSTVTITNNSGLSRTVTADANGRYNVNNLPVGNYVVTSGGAQRNVVVTVGGGANASFVGGDGTTTLGTVTVTAASASVIDVSTVSTSTVLTSKDLARLPLVRSAEAVALLAPGAVGGNTVGGFGNVVSFGGSSVAENAYYINGFFTGNPMTNVGGYTLPYGSIEQQETYTGGYSAKYGRSDGGVINQIGKSGSNEFHFGGQVSWTPKGLRDDNPDRNLPNEMFPAGYEYSVPDEAGILFSRGNKNKSWNQTYSAYVSGPLIKDRLFGFISAEQDHTESQTFPSSLGAARVLRDETKNPKMYAKLNWNITDNHLLEATYMAQRTRYDGYYNAYDFDADVEGSANGAFPDKITENDEFSILKYTGYLTDNLTLSAMYGHSRLSYTSLPTITGAPRISSASRQNPAYWPVGTPPSGITNNQVSNQGVIGARDYGDGLRVELEWVLGNHTLTAGIDNQKFEAVNEGSSIVAPRWSYSRTNSPNNNINTTLDVGAPGQRFYVSDVVIFNNTSMSLEQKGWYLEDKWQLTDNLLLSLGLRNDSFTNKNDAGVAYVDTGSQWAPRLGFSWDVFGDSRFKAFGNAGRYYLALPQAVAVRGASASTFTQEYFTYTGIAADGSPTGLTPIKNVAGTAPAGPVSSNHETGQVKDSGAFVPTDLKSSYQDEFILGFQARLTDTVNFGAKVTYRNLKAAMDDTCDIAGMEAKLTSMGIDPNTIAIPGSKGIDGGCFIVNVGDSNTFSFANKVGGGRTEFRMTPDDWGWTVPMKRTYKALDLFVERPFDGTWEMRADYTYSKSFGNMEGPANSDSGQGSNSHGNGVATSVNWDGPAFMYYSMGYLPNDRRHQLKVRGSYAFNPEWMVSGNVRIMSGSPINCFGFLNANGGLPQDNETDPVGYQSAYYHTCFGEISAPGKKFTPWTKRFDLGVTYKPAFLDHKLELSLNVLNALNGNTATSIDGVTEEDFGTVSNTYNMPLAFQTPRYVTLSAAYNW
ncbi:MAG: TonB-dependent receptor [Thermomonas sp.]